MRVLHIVPSYLPATRYGGTIYAVHGLCKALANAGHQVTVFTTNVDGSGNSDVPLDLPVVMDGVNIWYFPTGFLRRLYRAPRMAHALRRQISSFEVIHLHSVFLWPTWAAARIARKAGVPYLITPHGMLVKDLIRRKSRWLKTAWIRLIEKRNLEQAAGIHVTAPIEQDELRQFEFRLPPVYCVPNGIEPIESAILERATSGLVPDARYVLFLSRINWKKGLDRLVLAWRNVTDTLLVIAGNDEEGYWSEIQRLVQSEGVTNRVRFIGAVQGRDKWLLYKNAELFVLPSYSENFGIVVLEAMAMGCPVLVTPEVGLAPTIAEADCGRVVDGDPDALAGMINKLLADAPLLKAMGRNGQEVAHRQFLWKSVAVQMESTYRQIIAEAWREL